MITNSQMMAQIESANQFIDKNYLEYLKEYQVKSLDSYFRKHNLSRLYHVEKIIYDKKENINEKLVSVFHSVMPFCKNIVLILKGSADRVDLYLGIRASQISNAAAASAVLHDSFLGNFPGSRISDIDSNKIQAIFTAAADVGITAPELRFNVAYINILPSERNKEKQGEFVQGLEKFIDTMRGSEYICEILATPVRGAEIESRLNGFEELYSALFPFSKKTSSHGHNEGTTLTEGITESISDSISKGISKAIGKSDTYSRGTNKGFNLGTHMLLNFGFMNGTHEGWSAGTSETDTNTDTRIKTNVYGQQSSASQTMGTTDNLTIEFRNKSIENLLEKIERHIKRMKAGSSYGTWETATYFLSKKKKTAAIAASTYRAILLGEETGIERPNFTLFESTDASTKTILDSLEYCEHPMFLVPSYENANSVAATEALSPTCYLNGKELALLFNLPRKSVNGIMVSEMAEFGRNVLAKDSVEKRCAHLGNIYHMGQKENAPVELNIDSLTSHCFITGSTGSGKSNTVYKLIEEVIKEPYNVPFLVIEPAKGEYRNEFRNISDINLFSTNPQIDQMLKLNPFAFCDGIHILEHLDRIVEVFNGCWEMYAAMPAILKEAIEESYINKGWDLLNSVFIGDGEKVFPTFADVLAELPKIINSSEYSADTKGDYIGALVTRVNSMTNGIYGQIFCDDFEVDDKTLFDENTIIDLSRVGSAETKSLIMGVLILKLTEYRIANAERGNSKLRHLTILEEAHNILKNSKNIQSTTGNSVIAKSVEMIVNSIAEMRTYGEGFIIVDQSPTSIDIAAIKNTNTKIIMRLPEADDCEIAGHSVSLSDQQRDELAKLETGVAVVMQNNWSEPVLALINESIHPYEGFEEPVSFDTLRKFRSVILSELINQYELSDNHDISRIIHSIENFDIITAKKEEMRRLVLRFDSIMSKEYDSILFGRTMLRLTGCNDVFRKAEKLLRFQNDSEGNRIAEYTPESLSQWYTYIDFALPQYIMVDEQQRDIIRQYILHSMKFENHSISYSLLYQQIYKDIK